jgi:hypothetical protein
MQKTKFYIWAIPTLELGKLLLRVRTFVIRDQGGLLGIIASLASGMISGCRTVL